MDVDLGVGLEVRDAIERDADRRIQLARLDFQDARVVVDHDIPFDPVELGQALLPIVRVALDRDDLAAPPFLHAESAGADRAGAEASPSSVTAFSGTIAAENIASVARNGDEGSDSVITTVRSSGA